MSAISVADEIEEIKRMSFHDLRIKFEEIFGERPRARKKKFFVEKIVKALRERNEVQADEDAYEKEQPYDESVEQSAEEPDQEGNDQQEAILEPEGIAIEGEPWGKKWMRDNRLPPPGTMIRKVDRHGRVRCECRIEKEGVVYAGTLYKSLTAASIAAMKDLGLNSKANGFVFWGLSRPKPRAVNVIEILERAWKRYHRHIEALEEWSRSLEDDARANVRDAIAQQAECIAQAARRFE